MLVIVSNWKTPNKLRNTRNPTPNRILMHILVFEPWP
jgi:hypothetical protein